MKTYSNPRRSVTIADWPIGIMGRVDARFEVEVSPKKGERVARTTTGKPKRSRYYAKCAIVDGDDGRTYFLGITEYGQISVMQGNMKFQEEAIFEDDSRHAGAIYLINAAT